MASSGLRTDGRKTVDDLSTGHAKPDAIMPLFFPKQPALSQTHSFGPHDNIHFRDLCSLAAGLRKFLTPALAPTLRFTTLDPEFAGHVSVPGRIMISPAISCLLRDMIQSYQGLLQERCASGSGSDSSRRRLRESIDDLQGLINTLNDAPHAKWQWSSAFSEPGGEVLGGLSNTAGALPVATGANHQAACERAVFRVALLHCIVNVAAFSITTTANMSATSRPVKVPDNHSAYESLVHWIVLTNERLNRLPVPHIDRFDRPIANDTELLKAREEFQAARASYNKTKSGKAPILHWSAAYAVVSGTHWVPKSVQQPVQLGFKNAVHKFDVAGVGLRQSGYLQPPARFVGTNGNIIADLLSDNKWGAKRREHDTQTRGPFYSDGEKVWHSGQVLASHAHHPVAGDLAYPSPTHLPRTFSPHPAGDIFDKRR